jgi:hypothetical protein
MVQRVLQRVDLVLERRLREVVGQLILEHTQTLTPRLREEIEAVVRQSVNQAFESEAVAAKKDLLTGRRDVAKATVRSGIFTRAKTLETQVHIRQSAPG